MKRFPTRQRHEFGGQRGRGLTEGGAPRRRAVDRWRLTVTCQRSRGGKRWRVHRAARGSGDARGGDRGVGDGRECAVQDEAPVKRHTTWRAIGARLGAVLAAPFGAPHGGEEAGDSWLSSPMACAAVPECVAQSRTGKE
jgi:hypothetical protein